MEAQAPLKYLILSDSMQNTTKTKEAKLSLFPFCEFVKQGLKHVFILPKFSNLTVLGAK